MDVSEDEGTMGLPNLYGEGLGETGADGGSGSCNDPAAINSALQAALAAIDLLPFSPASGSLNLPLPRPPAWIWLFTTHSGPPSLAAASTASSGVNAAKPRETGAPYSLSSALPWYSWMFIGGLDA